MYGFSLWLVGLTVVVMAAAIVYAFLAGRDRPRAYYGLMLMLIGAIVGVFTSQDLLLFYAMFEAMLIPLYVLVGVWGGAGRLGATFKFVAFTMAGSLLMLVSVIAFGLRGDVRPRRLGHERLELDLPRLRRRVRGQGAALPVPRLAAGRLPRGVAGGLGGAERHRLQSGRVRLPPDRDRQVPGADGRLPHAAPDPCRRRPRLRVDPRVPRAGPARCDRVLVARADGADHARPLRENSLGINGAVLQMVNHGLVSATLFLLAGAIERRTATGEFLLLGGMARGRPVLATLLMTTGVIALAVPGLERVRR